MSNRRKNAQNCWFFRRALSSLRILMNGFIKAAFILFWKLELFLGTRMDSVWNTNCSQFVQKLMRHLMRQ